MKVFVGLVCIGKEPIVYRYLIWWPCIAQLRLLQATDVLLDLRKIPAILLTITTEGVVLTVFHSQESVLAKKSNRFVVFFPLVSLIDLSDINIECGTTMSLNGILPIFN